MCSRGLFAATLVAARSPLRMLDLSGVVSSHALFVIADAIAGRHTPRLQTLKVDGGTFADDCSLQALMAALARDGTIRSLSLTNNSIRTAGARATKKTQSCSLPLARARGDAR